MTDWWSPNEMIIVMTSFPNKTKILKKLIIWCVRQWLCTCVQQINYMKSFYMWEWELKKEHEKLLLFKWPSKNKEKLISFIQKMHPYDTPEIIILSPSEVDKKYLSWILWS